MKFMKCMLLIGTMIVFTSFGSALAAYHHAGEEDSPNFVAVYPDQAGTKLDSCALCHTGGQGAKGPVGSCQWCHQTYGYDASGKIEDTLNPYGLDYMSNGRNEEALKKIEKLDSDGDDYSNKDEIDAVRYPGNANDDPSKVPAPSRVFTREELEFLPQHTQFLLMNTSKSGDFYAEYTGVPVGDLLDLSGILPSATGIKVIAPDGFSKDHSLQPDPDDPLYPVYGIYPEAIYYYDEQADQDLNADGWCDYSALSCARHTPDEIIDVPGGLKMILAVKRDKEYLTPGELTDENKLDGEGPFRIVPPQKVPGPPDQASNSPVQDVIWPYDRNRDHNAGESSRSATMIKVEPLPEGTTDIDILEAGWKYIDENKIIVYGAIDPLPIYEIGELIEMVGSQADADFKNPSSKEVLIKKLATVQKMLAKGNDTGAIHKIENDILDKTDGCIDNNGIPDKSDWVTSCELQKTLYLSIIHEISMVLRK